MTLRAGVRDHRPECAVNHPEPDADFVKCDCDFIPPHHWDPETRQWVITPDIFDRLMALWQQPWTEEAFGEAQMLVARLRAGVRDPEVPPSLVVTEKVLRDAWLRMDAAQDPRTAHTLWQHLQGTAPASETRSWREASRDLIANGDDTDDGLVPTHARRPDGSPADGGEAPSDRLSGSNRSHPSQPVPSAPASGEAPTDDDIYLMSMAPDDTGAQ